MAEDGLWVADYPGRIGFVDLKDGRFMAGFPSRRMRPTVVVVDDEYGVRSELIRELQDSYDVVAVSGTKEAMDVFDGSREVAAVVADLMMWGPIDGYELLEWIRRAAPRCRRILLSSVTQGEWYLQNGTAQGFVHKPWGEGEVLEVVRKLT